MKTLENPGAGKINTTEQKPEKTLEIVTQDYNKFLENYQKLKDSKADNLNYSIGSLMHTFRFSKDKEIEEDASTKSEDLLINLKNILEELGENYNSLKNSGIDVNPFILEEKTEINKDLKRLSETLEFALSGQNQVNMLGFSELFKSRINKLQELVSNVQAVNFLN